MGVHVCMCAPPYMWLLPLLKAVTVVGCLLVFYRLLFILKYAQELKNNHKRRPLVIVTLELVFQLLISPHHNSQYSEDTTVVSLINRAI